MFAVVSCKHNPMRPFYKQCQVLMIIILQHLLVNKLYDVNYFYESTVHIKYLEQGRQAKNFSYNVSDQS